MTRSEVKAITEELCRHSFSASMISTINKKLDRAPLSNRPHGRHIAHSRGRAEQALAAALGGTLAVQA